MHGTFYLTAQLDRLFLAYDDDGNGNLELDEFEVMVREISSHIHLFSGTERLSGLSKVCVCVCVCPRAGACVCVCARARLCVYVCMRVYSVLTIATTMLITGPATSSCFF